jgi:predicted metal-dependent phosphoesterase TrpH
VRDLHTHSNYSDGLLSPRALVELAAREEVTELSLTDHDTIAGLEEAQQTAARQAIGFMPGIEITCRFGGRAVHMLGYGFDPDVARRDRGLMGYLDGIRDRDYAWALQMCRKSLADPIRVRLDGDVHSITVSAADLGEPAGTMPSAFHLAAVVSRKLRALSEELVIPPRHCLYVFFGRLEPERWAESYWPEVRERYRAMLAPLGTEVRSYWWTDRPTGEMLTAQEAIQALQRIGAIPVVAHPGEMHLDAEEIEQLAQLGMRGVEVYSYKHTSQETTRFEAIAQRLQLITTGGTDYHDSDHRGQTRLGRDSQGVPLRGASLRELQALGATIFEPQRV